jgi:hypothetical protein
MGKIRKAPLECRRCGSPTGPPYEVNADCAGWMCDSCYENLQNPTKEGDSLQEITEEIHEH